MFKKLVLIISFTFLLLSSSLPFATTIHAQTWYNSSFSEWYNKVYNENTSPSNEIFGERYTAAQVQWVIYSIPGMLFNSFEKFLDNDVKPLTCLFGSIGTGVTNIGDCIDGIGKVVELVVNTLFPESRDTGYTERPIITQILDSKERSISGIQYTKNLIVKFNPITEVKAQSYGFHGLTWLQNYWKGFRDISYTLIVLVAIIFAFMIMFRVKLNPQTVISIQSALPKIVIALILITFSYAIAGFAIDLLYIISGLLALLLQLAGFTDSINNVFGLISGIHGTYAQGNGFFMLINMLAYSIMFIITAIINIVFNLFNGFSGFGMIVSFLFIFVGIWGLILMLWYTVKIPFVLIKTLISVYLSIITAPIQILAGTIIPSMGFGVWFKKLMADILVFPFTGLLIWLSWSTLWSSYGTMFESFGLNTLWNRIISLWGFNPLVQGASTNFWVPGIIGQTSGMGGIIFLAISFGIIVLIPKVPELLKSMIMGEKFSFGTAMGEAMAPGRAIWGMTGAPLQRSFQEISTKEMIYGLAGKIGAVDKFQWVPQSIKKAAQKMSAK